MIYSIDVRSYYSVRNSHAGTNLGFSESFDLNALNEYRSVNEGMLLSIAFNDQ